MIRRLLTAKSKNLFTISSSILIPIGCIIDSPIPLRSSEDMKGATLLSGNLKCLMFLQEKFASSFNIKFPSTSTPSE